MSFVGFFTRRAVRKLVHKHIDNTVLDPKERAKKKRNASLLIAGIGITVSLVTADAAGLIDALHSHGIDIAQTAMEHAIDHGSALAEHAIDHGSALAEHAIDHGSALAEHATNVTTTGTDLTDHVTSTSHHIASHTLNPTFTGESHPISAQLAGMDVLHSSVGHADQRSVLQDLASRYPSLHHLNLVAQNGTDQDVMSNLQHVAILHPEALASPRFGSSVRY